MSHHHEKITAELQRAIQKVLVAGLQDPRTEGALITVTSVSFAADEKNATVSVSVLPEKYEARVRAALDHSKGFIRREASDLVAIRTMPQLAFVIDHSLKKQAEVLAALNKVAQEREQNATKSKPAPDQESPRGNP